MPIGKDHVLYVQNGPSAWVRVVHLKSGAVPLEFRIPVGNTNGVHGQFRHGRGQRHADWQRQLHADRSDLRGDEIRRDLQLVLHWQFQRRC